MGGDKHNTAMLALASDGKSKNRITASIAKASITKVVRITVAVIGRRQWTAMTAMTI